MLKPRHPSFTELQCEPIELVPHQNAWSEAFDAERQKIAAHIGDLAYVIEHIGSTSVEGLPAKPVIDILVGLASLELAAACIDRLGEINYQYYPEYQSEMPDRYFMIKRDASGNRKSHVLLVQSGSRYFGDYINFRNVLRSSRKTAQRYAALKERNALKFHRDRTSYARAKASFIAKALTITETN